MMPKRTFWTGVGYSAGIASSIYVQRRVRRAVRRVAPTEIREAVGARGAAVVDRARAVGDTVVGAVREGRAAMRETEEQLREAYPPTPLRRVK
jgi:hypothetical protein